MPNLAVIGMQWGDEGKGKIVDWLASRFDIVARFQGGHNAGHSVRVDGTTRALHLVPSGIMHPGRTCVIGNGVVVDPLALLKELDDVRSWGVSIDGRVIVSDRAHVITRWHRALECRSESLRGADQLGTTRRGIGPTYALKAERFGIRMIDLLRPRVLRSKLEALRAVALPQVGEAGLESVDELEAELAKAGAALEPLIADVGLELSRRLKAGDTVLFEGAQGTLLDVDHGTYPFVTSSSASSGGVAPGLGIGPREVHAVMGVVKAYSTRVGAGPFPTELKDATGELIRERGREYGVSTGRPRRCGWFDGVVTRYTSRINGLELVAITLLDVLDVFEELHMASEYTHKGATFRDFPADPELQQLAQPVYKPVKGWRTPISACRTFEDLPQAARDYIKRIEDVVEAPVAIVSVGADREQTIVREEFFARWPARQTPAKPSA